jgi:hypothetical protein
MTVLLVLAARQVPRQDCNIRSMRRETMGNQGLGASIWCGIVAVAVGAAGLMVNVWVGLALLALGAAWFSRACYRDYRGAER